MNINEQLKTIRENLEAAEVDCYVSQLTEALYAFVPLLDAAEKVLELHKPIEGAVPYRQICEHCWGVDEDYLVITVDYPCPTVRTISTALEGK